MTHQLVAAARTHTGLLRQSNQDAVYAGSCLLVVADGMGGHAAGDLASRVVVSAFQAADHEVAAADLSQALTAAVTEGNRAIAELVADDPDLAGMGTTATAILFAGNQLALLHIGDSRAYLYRDGVLHQLSVDDTFVQSLIDEGRITADEAAHHPQRNLLLRALNGGKPQARVTVREASAADRYLLCSDGLSGVVPAESIADALAIADPEAAADRLIELALAGGGPDNVSVIVADLVATGLPPPPMPVADPDSTGPFQAAHPTRSMPRIALPPIPETPGDKPVFLPSDPPEDLEVLDVDDEETSADSGDELLGRLAEQEDRRQLFLTGRRHRRIGMLVGGLTLFVLAIVGSGLWISSKYYVAENNGRIVIYQGVPGSIFGIPLASVVEDSCGPKPRTGCAPLQVAELQPAARDQVRSGITVRNLEGAREVIDRLAQQTITSAEIKQVPATAGTSDTSSHNRSSRPMEGSTHLSTIPADGAPPGTGRPTTPTSSHLPTPYPGGNR